MKENVKNGDEVVIAEEDLNNVLDEEVVEVKEVVEQEK